MRVAILDARHGSGRTVEGSYTVAYRNLGVLRDELGADLFLNPGDIRMDIEYDAIICGFGSMSCERERSTEFLIKNDGAKLFWLVGEYEQSTFAPLFYCKRPFQIIKNFEHEVKNKKCIGQHFVNINTLLSKPQNRPVPKKYGCIYYGRWRPDRLKYFQQYLDSSVYLSTGSKNIKLFHHNGCNPKLIKPLDWTPRRETLNLFQASLYIEDQYTHTHYNCLGNRFYEALWCNCVPLFDSSCKNTLSRSGYLGWEWHIVNSPSDIADKVASIDNEVTDRCAEWAKMAMDEKGKAVRQVKKIIGCTDVS